MRSLSPTETRVAKTLVEVYGCEKDASKVLGLSMWTVKNHRKAIYNKLDVDCIGKLIRWAITTGLVSWDKK